MQRGTGLTATKNCRGGNYPLDQKRGSRVQGIVELCLSTPLGPLTLVEEDGGITRLEWRSGKATQTKALSEAAAQLNAYFAGSRTGFDLPLAPKVSDTQKAFLSALQRIPIGSTRTYGELAQELGLSAQGVGQLCGSNPIPILIPCHRVLGQRSLGGYSGAGGIETKVWLLKHEHADGLLI